MKKSILRSVLAAVFALAVCAVSFAAYPEKPVKVVVAYGAGGSNDILARITAKYLEKMLGQPFVVENRAGSGGDVGFTAIAKAPADGYTIGIIVVTPVIVNPITRPKVVRYNLDSFAPIANVVSDPGIVCVAYDSIFKTLADLTAAAKAEPGKINISHEGKGGGDHLGVIAYEKAAGISFSGVPFNGDAAAKAALMGGHIDAIAVNVSEVVDMINEKQLRALAVEGTERSKELPDVPTFLENGYNVVQSSSRGFAAPAGIPEEVRATLVNAFKKLAADPEYQAELKKLNMPLDFMDSEAYGKFLRDQYDLWSKIWAADPWLEQK